MTTTSSRNKGNSNQHDKRKQRKKYNRNHPSPHATFGATENGTTRTQPGCNTNNSITRATSSQLHHDDMALSQPREKVTGVCRIWGTLSNCTTTVVRNVINCLTDVGEQIELKRKYKSDRNRKRWFFLLKGSEEVLESLESDWEAVQIQTNWLEAWAVYQTRRSPWQPYISFFRSSAGKDSGYVGGESSHRFDRSHNELKILSLNARSLLPKIESLQLLVKAEDLDVICVVETWLSAEILDAEITI